MNEPRVYKHSNGRLLLVIIVFALILAGLFYWLTQDMMAIAVPAAVIIFFILIASILSLRSQTIITDDDISTKSIFGTKTLKWTEINRVSGRGYAIKLHNFDGDVTIAPSPQLPGYAEVIGIIGSKRPDLFNPAENNVLSRGVLSILAFLIMSAVYVGMSIFLYLDSSNNLLTLGFIGFFGLMVLVFMFLSVISVRMEGRTLTISYLLSKTVLKAEEIRTIGLNVTQTRYGKNYSIFMFTTGNRSIRFSGVGPSLPITYLVLKNWQMNNSQVQAQQVDIAPNWSSR
jgi:hypothetical protein